MLAICWVWKYTPVKIRSLPSTLAWIHQMKQFISPLSSFALSIPPTWRFCTSFIDVIALHPYRTYLFITFLSVADQHAAMLSYLNAVSWDCVLLENDTQTAFDHFYSVMLGILDYFYPTRSVFVTNRDPYFVMPVIKALLRKRNA